jgi:hypothetical protein
MAAETWDHIERIAMIRSIIKPDWCMDLFKSKWTYDDCSFSWREGTTASSGTEPFARESQSWSASLLVSLSSIAAKEMEDYFQETMWTDPRGEDYDDQAREI